MKFTFSSMNFEKESQLYNHPHNQYRKYFPHSKIPHAFFVISPVFHPTPHPARLWQLLAVILLCAF